MSIGLSAAEEVRKGPGGDSRRHHGLTLLMHIRQLAGWAAQRWRTAFGGKVPRGEKRSRRDAMLAVAGQMLLAGDVTLMVFELRDLRELERVFGAEAARKARAVVTANLERLAGRRGFAIRTGATTYAVLLAVADADRAVAAARAVLGNPCCIEVELDGEDIVLVPEFAAEDLTSDLPVRDVYTSLCRHIEKARPPRRPKHKAARRKARPDGAGRAAGHAIPPSWAETANELASQAVAATIPATMPQPIG